MKIDSHLEDRAFLLFNFYTPGGSSTMGGLKYTQLKMDFMENVQIQEQQTSRLSTYQPIGRNGNTYLHMGAESRKFSLSFNITLPNIMQYTTLPTPSARDNYEKKKAMREAYKNGGEQDPREAKASDMVDYINLVDQMFQGYLTEQEQRVNLIKALGENAFSLINPALQVGDVRTRAIAQVLTWMNLIRSSTLNHSERPQFGPPLVRLTHGIMYQNVPCITTGYSINIDGKSGYDNRTLLPRVIQVKMDLAEVRVSAGKNFDPTGDTAQEFDADVGWEVMQQGFVSYNRIDDEAILIERNETLLREGGLLNDEV